MTSLRKLLDTAIEEENYEEAARLRDKIRELENS
jgi:protein-arginine kinase activator protein McsA